MATARNNAYPQLPFASHSWRLSHHTGVLTPILLHQLLLAASIHQDMADPIQHINNYLVNNQLLPPNIRDGQVDIWRDYQQILSELGLIFSTRQRGRIRLTSMGLALLDGTSSFKDILTIQSFKWQYPNGHNTQRSSGDEDSGDFSDQQARSGILIRPAVLVWQVLLGLHDRNLGAHLAAAEIEHFLIPVRLHGEAPLAIEMIARHRAGGAHFPSGQTPRRRNASDWIKRLSHTHAFQIDDEGRIALSQFSFENRERLREVMDLLLGEGAAWWISPAQEGKAESWYQWYGTQDTLEYPIPPEIVLEDYPAGVEPDDTSKYVEINLQEYRHIEAPHKRAATESTISSTYSADLSESAHRLHDSMVRLIAEKCEKRKAAVFFDPDTVDLLIQHEGRELIIEVKSATSVNFVRKLRGALGQVLQYDYLRSRQVNSARRKGIALTIDIAAAHWSKEFIADHMDMDLIGLRSGALAVHSNDQLTNSLLG